MFCSEKCLQEAMDSYFLQEAKLIDLMAKTNVTKSEWMIAFRAILKKPMSYFLEHKDDILIPPDLKYGTNLKEGGYGSDLKSYINLVLT